MGVSFRKSLSFGPIRVNLSGAGVGFSTGVRGARVSVGPRGTNVTLGAGGFLYRRKLSDSASQPRPATQALVSAEPADGWTVRTASMTELQAATPDDVSRELQERLTRVNLAIPFWVVAAVSVAVLASRFGTVVGAGAAVLVVGLAVVVHRWDSERRSVRLLYDIDDPALIERFALAAAAGESLGGTRTLWRVTRREATSDWKRNAGASSLLQRNAVRSVNEPLPGLETNLLVWSVPVGAQRVCFLPDRLLVLEGSRLAFLSYESIDATCRPTRFIEDGSLPSDAEIVDRTWQFVNRTGGPDRRFKNNRQLPVARYGELELTGAGGLHLVFQTSKADAASRAAAALTVLRDLARTARAERRASPSPAQVSGPPGVVPTPAPAPIVSQASAFRGLPDAELELATSITILLSWLARADRRFGEEERREVEKLVISYVGGSASLRNAVQGLIDQVPKDDESAATAMSKLKRLDIDARAQVVADAWQLARADGKVTPKERERLATVLAGLEVPAAAIEGLAQ